MEEKLVNGDAEALYDLLSAESSGRDNTQDQSGGGSSRIGGTSLERKASSVQRIAQRAYELYEKRGRQDVQAVQDWEQAEHEIRKDEVGQGKPASKAS